MAELKKIVAPADKYDMPLPIVVRSIPGLRRSETKLNKHHSNFDATRLELRGLDGRALSAARIQRVAVCAHQRFHLLFDGPDMDYVNSRVKGEAVFARLPLYFSGYVPTHGIDPYSEDPEIDLVRLSPSRRARIGATTDFDGKRNIETGLHEPRPEIGNFAFGFILDNFVEIEDLENVDALAHKKNKQKRLIRNIARRAVLDASALAHPMYKRARQDEKTTRNRDCVHASDVVFEMLDKLYRNRSTEEVFQFEIQRRTSEM